MFLNKNQSYILRWKMAGWKVENNGERGVGGMRYEV
jgi:hypothetical protein